MKDTRIHLTESDIQRWTAPLMEYYTKNKGKTLEEAAEIIDEVFGKVSEGWTRAPKDLDVRIRMKTGFQWKSHENLNPIKAKIEKAPVGSQDKETIDSQGFIYQYLKEDEQIWWNSRLVEYRSEFRFNNSSDKPLLFQLLFEELMQRRIFLKQLKGTKDYGKELTESLKRVTELQVKLGITREQREGALDNIDGNVAEISMHLSRKLEVMPKELKQMYDEELRYQALRNQRVPANILPAKETMMAIINKEGTGRKLEVTNAAAQEISEIASNKLKEEARKIELPSGEKIG